MTIIKIKTIDQITVVENGIVQVREATKITEDGTELSRTFHRWTLTPGQDITDQDDRVKAVCQAAWTPEVVQAYKARQGGVV